MRLVVIFFVLFFSALAHAAGSSVGSIGRILKKFQETLGACDCELSALNREAGERAMGQASLKDVHGKNIPVTVMNDEFALKMFQEMTVQKKIPFGFPEDGCYARAHEMAVQLEKKKIYTAKVFATGKFRVDAQKAARGSVTWGFHVAPVIIVDDGKSRRLWVIDPSLFYEPTSLETWLETLTSHEKSELKSVFLTSRFIFHPSHRDKQLTTFDPDDLLTTKRIMDRYLKTDDRRTKRALDNI